jgi:DNA modification methylase
MISNRLISRIRKIDWDFAGNMSESPFSAIHWHPARFASQIPASLIGLLTKEGDTVLDPFMGSATTLVEAQRLGRRSVGIDLNPVACLIGRAKTLRVSARAICAAVEILKARAVDTLGEKGLVNLRRVYDPLVPLKVQAEKWYTNAVLNDLGRLWSFMQSLHGRKKVLAEAAFSAILLPVCRETRHWGYVCDNSTPKGAHGGNVLLQFCGVLDRLCDAYEEREADLRARFGTASSICEALVLCEDSRLALSKLLPESIDMVLTSPPYFGVSDYVKSQRLSMEWFGYEIEPLRQLEIGARSKRHRASATHQYASELSEVFAGVRRCLKEDGLLVVIVGQSHTRETILPGFRDALHRTGFRLILDVNRKVSSQRRQPPSIAGEHLFLLSKFG